MRVLRLIFLFLFFCCSLSYSSEYSREAFKHWTDIDHDHFDARQQALKEQAVMQFNILHVNNSKHSVDFGTWLCPYTGRLIYDPSELDADHIVPLKWAWEHGAEKWDDAKREMFANDQFNIALVSNYINRAKGAKGPEEWLPPNLCNGYLYVLRFIAICDKYDLEYDKKYYNEILNFMQYYRNGIIPYKNPD